MIYVWLSKSCIRHNWRRKKKYCAADAAVVHIHNAFSGRPGLGKVVVKWPLVSIWCNVC